MTRADVAAASRPDVAISVVIPIRNAAEHLPALLRSLAAQDVRDAWEVIAVDNGSTDESRRVVTSFVGGLPLTLVEATERRGPSYARNAGVRRASGRKLLFIDADDVIAPGYVAAMSAALDDHEMVTSRVDSTSLNGDWVRDALGVHWQVDGVQVYFSFLPAAGANIGIRREAFDRLQGFPDEFTVSEDIAFSWNAYLAGVRVHFVRDAVYRYRYRTTQRALFRQAVRWGSDHVLLYRRYRGHGMPERPMGQAFREWRDASLGWFRSRERSQSAPYLVRLGLCVGRMTGTLRYGVLYL